jgi:Zn-dependent peptidase ImmA (M78 family)/DNA-binding XRE family transcriptional regulator
VTTASSRMIILAREARELTQTELAELVSTSQAVVSKVESGLRPPSSELIATISQKLDFPLTFFLRDEPLYDATNSILYHRKRESLPKKKLASIHAWLNIHRLAASALERSVEISPAGQLPELNLEEYGSPESIARAVRAAWNLPRGPVANVTALIEDFGGVIIRRDLGTHLIDAVSQWVPGYPHIFLINSRAPGDRIRFTLMHEVAHLIMHRIPNPEMEHQADRFASEFLMPEREIRSSLVRLNLRKLASLKPYWKVSMQALLYRARDLGTITAKQSSYFWMNMGKLGYRMAEPAELNVALEEPTLPRHLISAHRNALGYSREEICSITGLSATEIRTNFLGEAVLRVLQ